MFTGIVETMGQVTNLDPDGENLQITVASPISNELKIDQSISHNGVCLTVVRVNENSHTVTAIKETLERSNLGQLRVGASINLERAMMTTQRLDGHIVQGHVDDVATCIKRVSANGSWYYEFEYDESHAMLLVDKGSICVNGVSLTLVSPTKSTFQVAIIPYTYDHTNFNQIEAGRVVNLEFDIMGKYFARYASLYRARF